MSMPTPTPFLDRGPHETGPHLSAPAGWALLMAFLGFTVMGIALYLVRLGAAAT